MKHENNISLSQLKFLIFSLFIISGLYSCTRSENKLIIATAANTQFAMQEIAANFTVNTGIETELIISSSGKHTAQIIAGAPYDIFISADMKYPKKLHDENLTTTEPVVYAYGQLVLWSLNNDRGLHLEDLRNIDFAHLAMPNPETAPYGLAAREALQAIDLWQSLSPQLIFGESVAQANQYIISGAAEAGFTASSIVMAPANKQKGHWTIIPDSLYSPIAQGAVVLKRSNKTEQAEKFYKYLFSEEAMTTLMAFGYRKESGQ